MNVLCCHREMLKQWLTREATRYVLAYIRDRVYKLPHLLNGETLTSLTSTVSRGKLIKSFFLSRLNDIVETPGLVSKLLKLACLTS